MIILKLDLLDGTPIEIAVNAADASRINAYMDEARAFFEPPPNGVPGKPVATAEQAANYVEALANDYSAMHGSYDTETGQTEFSTYGQEYMATLMEIAEGIRALKVISESK